MKFSLSILLFLSGPFGFSQELTQFFPQSGGSIVQHTHYSLAYSEEHEQAIWVFYELESEEAKGGFKRRDDFRADPLVTTESATLADYKASGYDRGHLAPAADMAFSENAISESFYMSNMSPQKPSFNRGIWKKLEAQFRDWALADGSLYIVTGPVLSPGLAKMGSNAVSIPKYYYKLALDFDADELGAIAFLLPNTGLKADLQNFIISIDSLESITGIDFFAGLDDQLEAQFEAQAGDFNFWKKNRPAPVFARDSIEAAVANSVSAENSAPAADLDMPSSAISKYQWLAIVFLLLLIVLVVVFIVKRRSA
ncbi:MAG: DNA/RNA endonuclease [Bacteroidetes bacterium]|nr:MAG: DNA/RNA endonuclease [Bacteroidota bacterium]